MYPVNITLLFAICSIVLIYSFFFLELYQIPPISNNFLFSILISLNAFTNSNTPFSGEILPEYAYTMSFSLILYLFLISCLISCLSSLSIFFKSKKLCSVITLSLYLLFISITLSLIKSETVITL